MGDLYSWRLTAEVSPGASATKTLWMISTASTDRAKLVEVEICSNGSAAGTAAMVDLYRPTTAGTSTSRTPVKYDTNSGAAASTLADTFTGTEPTVGDLLNTWELAPNGMVIIKQWPLGREFLTAVSGRIGLRIVTPAGWGAAVMGSVSWEE